MHILWLSHIVPYPPKGGVLQRSYNLVRELARRHEVSLLSFVQTRPLVDIFGDADTGLAEARKALSEFCRDVHFVAIPSEQRWAGMARLAFSSLFTRDPYTLNWLKSPAFGELLARTDLRAVDCVHLDTISLVPYRGFCAGKPLVLDHHNIESQMMARRAQLERNPAKKAYFAQEAWKLARVERQFCPDFASNIVCSALDGERLKQVAGELTFDVIPNGVDLDYFRPQAGESNPPTLIFAGRLSAYTNRRAALTIVNELWPLIRDQLPDVVFKLVGASPPPEARRLAAEDPRFVVTGFVDDVREHLDAAAIYVCPITDGGGTKLKVLDALAMSKPLVADPIACEGIEVVDGESVLYAQRPQDYVDRIAELLRAPQRRRQLGLAGRQLVEREYAYSAIGSKLAAVYERAAASI